MHRLSMALLLLAPGWGAERVVELETARVSAATVFPDAGSDADFGPAPAPGVRRRVTQGQLLRWARQAGVDAGPDDLPETLTLVRKLRSLGAEEAEKLAASLLGEQIGAEAVEVELEGYAARDIPAGPLEWSLMGNPTSLERPVRLGLRWRDGGGRSGVESVMARVTVRAHALVALRDLPAGAPASAADFAVEIVDLPDLRAQYLTKIEGDRLLILKEDVKAGEPLTEARIDRRPLVERGAVLELIATIGAVRLRAPARAEGRGSRGDLVPFRNLATNQRVVARVVSAQTAEAVSR